MEPAVRSPRIEPAIITDQLETALLASQDSKNVRQPTGIGRQNPAAGNGIFGCRDWRLKIALRDRKCHRRPKESNDTGENPHRNGLSGVGAGICGFVGLDGGDDLDQTACSPRSHRTSLRNLEPGTEFFAAETGAQNPPFRLLETGIEARRDSKSPR